MDFNPGFFLITITTLIFSIAVHEWAHAVTADYLGDDTPRSQGRVTLWPPAHLDPMGTIFMIASTLTGFGLGWGKPVLTNPVNYKRTSMRIGDSLVAFAGPLSNLVIAGAFALPLRFGLLNFDPFWQTWALVIVLINVSLFCFNLLPIFPLDGSHLFLNALPGGMAENARRWMMSVGPILLLALVLTRSSGYILNPLTGYITSLLLGG